MAVVLMMVVSLAACQKQLFREKGCRKSGCATSMGKDDDREVGEEIPFDESQWGQLAQGYFDDGALFLKCVQNGQEQVWAVKDGNCYVKKYDSEAGQVTIGIMVEGQDYLELYPEEKTYKKYDSGGEQQELKQQKELFFGWFPLPQKDWNQITIETGQMEYQGKTYDYEALRLSDQEEEIYLYESNQPIINIHRQDGKDSVYEELEIKNQVEDRLFELPSGYRLVE